MQRVRHQYSHHQKHEDISRNEGHGKMLCITHSRIDLGQEDLAARGVGRHDKDRQYTLDRLLASSALVNRT